MENKDTRTFEINPKIEMKKVRFTNRYGITLAGDLYLPTHYEDKKNPAVIVAGEKAHSRYYSEDAYAAASEPKELLIVPGADHVDLYDNMEKIPFDKLEQFFNTNLR